MPQRGDRAPQRKIQHDATKTQLSQKNNYNKKRLIELIYVKGIAQILAYNYFITLMIAVNQSPYSEEKPHNMHTINGGYYHKTLVLSLEF